MEGLEFPSRYEPLRRLGKGGGGEVWAVRDRYTHERLALKVLAADATESEMAALVREAVALSGLEGLGVPRVHRFGRLPGKGRPFMVRELVEGRSLQELIEERSPPAESLDALAGAAAQVTLLHRAGLLHGDIKPANVIVEPGGRATLVDLGLAAPWRDAGTTARGLTPRYAAPELLLGKPLTVRAEVYALGVALSDIVEAAGARLDEAKRKELFAVVQRANETDPSARYPSADELSIALRRAAGPNESNRSAATAAPVWPIVGIEATASRLLQTVTELPSSSVLSVRGRAGSGRSVLLRRLAWSLGVEGRPLAWIDESLSKDATAVRGELGSPESFSDLTILVDDAEELCGECADELVSARRLGARVVAVGEGAFAKDAAPFEVPPLGSHAAIELLRRAVPSLTERLVKRVVEASEGRPGRLRDIVNLIAGRTVASDEDLEELLSGLSSPRSLLPDDPLARATALLDRGRYNDAASALDRLEGGDSLAVSVLRSRLSLGLGDPRAALDRLLAVEREATEHKDSALGKCWRLNLARARMGLGDYAIALELLATLLEEPGALGAEAMAHRGLALSYVGKSEEARAALEAAIASAKAIGARRVEALAEACLASSLQREDDIEAARPAYERAILAAEAAGDAGILAMSQANLGGLLKISGDIAGAIEHFEAAVDMGRRSGRRATVRSALLNLANTDLFLGRIGRAKSSIEVLDGERASLSPPQLAQLFGLEAELFGRSNEFDRATGAYERCADAYRELGLAEAAAEARLEGVLAATRAEHPDVAVLKNAVSQAEADLAETTAHRPLLSLARGSVAWVEDNEVLARRELNQALSLAREAGQRDFVWRALESRSEIEEVSGQPVSARRDREEALSVLEEIAGRLPRDLREVFWNDPRRRRLRSEVAQTLGSATTESLGGGAPRRFVFAASATSSIAALTSTPLERRLARILEINAELLGEVNLERLAARVTDHAVDMLQAERGFVLLRDGEGALTIHTSRARAGDAHHNEFSRSIAEQVVRTGEPVVAMNAKGDARLRSFASVHQLALESVACVPIQSRTEVAIGALYVETRLRPGSTFERELPTLRAFADQVAIALETAALIRENSERAAALSDANQQLEKAQLELKELLGDRTAQLKRTRQKLRDARDTLYGHFGYQGLVGTSTPMRRVYALIDRVKDTDVPILVTGESGTGKEIAARAIHRGSPRADRPFLALNCGAVPEHLLESELFGHVRGAFTGADRERKGLFREADGGTLLLDEIGEMPPKMQTGLLRVLQEKKVRPVGGSDEQSVDVRLVFATHRDLDAMVKEGRFREDLFYRIHVVDVHLPPLRSRTEDVPPLVDHFLGIFAARYKREKRSVSRDALRRLSSYSWPGNVRQLEHVLLNAWVLSDAPVLEPEDFEIPDGQSFANATDAPSESLSSSRDGRSRRSPQEVTPPSSASAVSRPLAESSGEVPDAAARPAERGRSKTISRHHREERERILQALQSCNWNRVQAAKVSGIPRRTFYRRLREYGIQ